MLLPGGVGVGSQRETGVVVTRLDSPADKSNQLSENRQSPRTVSSVSFHVTCKTQDGPTFRYARIRENPGTRLNTRFFRGKPLE